MTFKTRGIVLRAVKYGETSLVVLIFTELFGIQTYLVNGIRTTGKSGNKAPLYQPGSLLELEVYHNEMKSMNRIKEAGRSYLFQNLFNDVIRYGIAQYMIELLQKTLKHPEKNEDLFYFCEDSFIRLDTASGPVMSNYPLFFALHLPFFLGFRIAELPPDISRSENIYLDWVDGIFTDKLPKHPHHLENYPARVIAEFLRVLQPSELEQIKLNRQERIDLLFRLEDYYALHIQQFGKLKTLPILHELLS